MRPGRLAAACGVLIGTPTYLSTCFHLNDIARRLHGHCMTIAPACLPARPPGQVFATGNEYLERCNGTPAFLAPEMMKPNTRYRCGTRVRRRGPARGVGVLAQI